MPLVFPASGFGRSYQQTAKAGVIVTSHATTAHTMGNWTTLIDPLTYDCFGLFIAAHVVSQAATDTRMLMDIGIGPTGGGSEQIVVPFLDVGAAAVIAAGLGKTYFFPLYIPAGKAVRARCQSKIVADTVTVHAHAFELPPHGFAEDAPQEWTQYGADAATSSGVAVTSGNNAYGTEVQVSASTGRNHRWFHVGIDWGSNTVVNSGRYRVRLARDTAAADIIGVWEFGSQTANEDINGPAPDFPACVPVAAGSTLYVDVDGAAEAMAVIVYAA